MKENTALLVFLVSTLVTSESIIISVFGNLYSVYSAAIRDGGAPICKIIRILCLVLTAAILLIACVVIYLLSSLPDTIHDLIPQPYFAILYLIPIVLLTAPVVITFGVFKDS